MKKVTRVRGEFPPVRASCPDGGKCHAILHRIDSAEDGEVYVGFCSHRVFYWVGQSCADLSRKCVNYYSRLVRV